MVFLFINLDLLFRMRSSAEDNCQIYKNELKRTNFLFEENEKMYFSLMEKLKLNEENRISFLKYHFEKFGKYFEEFNKLSQGVSLRFLNYSNEINLEEDIKEFDEKFNYRFKNHERIPREEFLNYDIYRKNLEKMFNSNKEESNF